MLIVYICHNQESVDVCNIKSPNSHILLVGPDNAVSKFPERLTIVRDLTYNIEDERKLLTFTAWYAIVKNNLFLEHDTLCILEWDATLTSDIPDIHHDVVFFLTSSAYFFNEVSSDLLKTYLTDMGLHVNEPNETWGTTTNVILRRHVLEKFVDMYYPSSIQHLKKDLYNFSYYHERVFSMFVKTRGFSVVILPIIHHVQYNSHQSFR